jgi:hypothetical protein
VDEEGQVPIQVVWDNIDKTVIRFEFEGSWTWDDLYQASDEATAMLDTVPHMVDFVLDVRNANQIPRDFMNHAGNIANGQNPKRGLLVVVGANRLLRTLGGTLRRLFPQATKDVKIVGTLEEAYEVISKQHELR